MPRSEPRDRHPERALLVIEVADTSVGLDLGLDLGLGRKARIDAAAGVPVSGVPVSGVPVYWVIDVTRDVVHVHTDPVGQVYASVVVHAADEPLDACGVTVALRELRGA